MPSAVQVGDIDVAEGAAAFLGQLGDLSLHLAERFPLAKRMMMQQANGLNPFKRG